MSAHGFVDWGLAERVALALGGNDATPAAFDQDALDAACGDAVGLVLDYSRLRPVGELPQPELVDRAEWARMGLRTMRELADRLERRVADGLSLPGPLGGLARSLAGAAAGAEAGVAVGYGARKVLGQYDFRWCRRRGSRAWCSWARTSPPHISSWGRIRSCFCVGSRSTRTRTRSSSPRSPGFGRTWAELLTS